MPSGNAPLSETRFEITLDGQPVGRFETLVAATAPSAAPRALQVHELPLLLQNARDSQSSRVTTWEHNFELRPGKFSPLDHSFETPSGSPQSGRHPHRIIDVTLKRGVCNQALIERWQMLGASSLTLFGLSPTGQPIARYEFRMAWPRKYSAAADQPAASWDLKPAWPSKYQGATDALRAGRLKVGGPALPGKGGGDIAIEEIVIAHEGMRLD